jgi:hypothetical protein
MSPRRGLVVLLGFLQICRIYNAGSMTQGSLILFNPVNPVQKNKRAGDKQSPGPVLATGGAV